MIKAYGTRWIGLLMVGVVSSGCIVQVPEPTVPSPTPVPSATAAPSATSEPAATIAPSATTAPTVVQAPTMTAAPAVPTTTPAGPMGEKISIAAPAAGSAISSPVRVSGSAGPFFENQFQVRVTDAGGKAIGQSTAMIQADAGGHGPYQADVTFPMPADGSPGRIEVRATSPRDGGLVYVNSVNVVFGLAATPAPAQAPSEDFIVITRPVAGSTITSTIHVAGRAGPAFEQQLAVHLVGEDGKTLLEQTATIRADAGQRGPFAVDLQGQLPAGRQAARIVVFTTSLRDGGIDHLNSVEVTLQP